MSTPESRHSEVGRHLVALGLCCASTVAFFAKALPALGTSIVPHGGDPVFNLYILKWGAYQIARGMDGFWNAPFFYPTPDALSLSDHLLGPAAAFHALRLLGVPPLATYNLLVLTTFALGGWTTYWVLRRSGVSWTGAVLGGWVFSFSTFRWGSLGHYQAIRMQWIPMTLWTFDRLLAKPSPGRAAAFLIFYALHISGGAYLAYLIHIVLGVLLVNRWLSSPAAFRQAQSWIIWMPTAGLAFGIAALLYAGYLAPDSTLMAGTDQDNLRRGGPVLALFVPPLLGGSLLPHRAGAGTLFPGVAVTVLALVALRQGWRGFAAPNGTGAHPVGGPMLASAGALAGLGGLLLADRFTVTRQSLLPALTGRGLTAYIPPLVTVAAGCILLVWGLRLWRGGPVLRWHDIPAWPRGLVSSGAVMLALCLPAFFWLLSTVLPGMQAMRVPHRSFAFVALPLAYLAGVGWDRLREWKRPRIAWQLVPLALGVLLLAEGVHARPALQPQSLPDEADFPLYAKWIAEHPEVHAYLELPRGRRSSGETVPMYFQTLHWRPLANGHSGRQPASYRELMLLCHPFPDVNGLRQLAEGGITHLVVHWSALPWHPGRRLRPGVQRARPGFERALRRYGARRVFADGNTVILDIRAEKLGRMAAEEDPA